MSIKTYDVVAQTWIGNRLYNESEVAHIDLGKEADGKPIVWDAKRFPALRPHEDAPETKKGKVEDLA